MRGQDEIREDLRRATDIQDTEAMLRYAQELDDVDTPQSQRSANFARGSALYLRGDYTAALEHYHRALAIHEELGDRNGVASTTSSIGVVYYNTGDFPAALEHYHRALALHKELGNRSDVAIITGNIGNVHWITGDYPAALEHYHRALAFHEELGDRSGVARVTGNIGNLHNSTGDYTAGLEYYQRALAIHEELGERSGVARVTGNIGSMHGFTGEYPAALQHYHRALALYEELGNRSGVVRITGNILDAYVTMGSDAEAKELLQVMDPLQIDEPDVRISRHLQRATLQERNGDLAGATLTFQRTLAEALELGLRSQAAEIHKTLRELALKQSDLASYVEHNNEFARITEEIKGKEATLKLAMQETKRVIDARERAKQLAVLHSTLPKHIADRVARGEVVNDHYDNAAVIFIDIVSFTTLSSALTSQHLTTLLDNVFAICDEACKNNSVTRIKTIGDSYLAIVFPTILT